MGGRELRILAVHGLCDRRLRPWKLRWRQAIAKVFPEECEIDPAIRFLEYEDLFAGRSTDDIDPLAATAKLLRTGLNSLYGIQAKGFYDVPQRLQWTARHLTDWVQNPDLREVTVQRLRRTLQDFRPQVLLAHSLGSLIAYDAFVNHGKSDTDLAEVMKQLTFVSLGSQIANPFVIGHLTLGRIMLLPGLKRWIHLHNPYDNVFTAPIRLWDAENFVQVETPFRVEGCLNHAVEGYLEHPAASDELWTPLATEVLQEEQERGQGEAEAVPAGRASRGLGPGFGFLLGRRERPPRRRALLVGINEYPNQADRLSGCVNDAYLVSSMLQNFGFDPAGIRLCLNHRATTAGIQERLEWLLEDPRREDVLFFYFSGHGAQLPTYGEGDEVDRRDETLAPHDFDWSPQTSITDDQIYSLYSQLPYDTRLVMVFDCCHSGGIHRAGQPRAKGLSPPDDIRHRGLTWKGGRRKWRNRELAELNSTFSCGDLEPARFFGAKGATARLGRAASLRLVDQDTYDSRKQALGNERVGPYLPMILEACQEDEFAYEYRQGVESYGAFTYALVSAAGKSPKPDFTYNKLITRAARILKNLDYHQKPQILGPGNLLDSEIEWLRAAG